ncbi:unnamed protein product [Ectocarpus sp. 12 AP-2014]
MNKTTGEIPMAKSREAQTSSDHHRRAGKNRARKAQSFLAQARIEDRPRRSRGRGASASWLAARVGDECVLGMDCLGSFSALKHYFERFWLFEETPANGRTDFK